MNRLRLFLILNLGLVLSCWVTAQHAPRAPSAAEQLQLLQSNQGLLQALLDDGLRLSQADTTLKRATECHQAAKTLAQAIEKSASSSTPEPERLAELGEHFTKLVQEGLAPTLAEARQQIPPGSRDFPRLRELHQQTKQSFAALQKSIPSTGPIAESRPVIQLKQTLATLNDQFPTP
jgi:hypothetical protein